MPLNKKFFVLIALTLIFLVESFFVFKGKISAESSLKDKLYIAALQTAGKYADGKTAVDDEYVELYNPNNYAVDLKGWTIKRATSSGSDGGYISSDLGKKISPDKSSSPDTSSDLYVPAFGYFLLVPRFSCGETGDEKCYVENTEPDNFYSADNFLADDNALMLYDGSKNLVDKVGWGKSPIFYGSAFGQNIAPAASLERVVVNGKMQNTFDNGSDFALQSSPQIHNASFIREESVGMDNENNNIDNSNSNSNNTDFGTSAQNDDRQNNADNTADSKNVEKKIIVSEMLINPVGEDDKLEFVELYNAGKDAVDLDGWSVEDESGKTSVYVFPKNSLIASGEYKILYSVDTKISLNNSGDGIVLKDNSGSTISKTPLSTEAGEGISYALDENGSWKWSTVITPGEKNIIKVVEVKNNNKNDPKDQADTDSNTDQSDTSDIQYDFSDKVIINEILPNPSGKDNQDGAYEWVELYNDNDAAVNLRGWFLDDTIDKGSKPYRFMEDKIIPAKGYLVISSEETKLSLNNSDDEVNLIWPDQKTEDVVSYKNADEDLSYSLNADGSWFWTKEKTPGKVNAKISVTAKTTTDASGPDPVYQNSDDFTEAGMEDGDSDIAGGKVLGDNTVNKDQYKYVSIAEAKKLPPKTLVGLDGIVSAVPEILGKGVFYLADKNSGEGMQMFSYQDKLPGLFLGDQVQVFGYMSEVGGEKRLVLDDNFQIEKMSVNNLLSATPIKCDRVDESVLGNLVKLEGTATDIVDSSLFYLQDDSGKIKIYAEPATGTRFEGVQAGGYINVTGIVSRTSLGYRILPRFSTDVYFSKNQFNGIIEQNTPNKLVGENKIFSWNNLLLVLSFLLVVDWLRIRIKMKKRITA